MPKAFEFKNRINIISYANVVGKFEGEGPLSKHFDMIVNDEYFGEKTYEKAETKLQKTALDLALQKSLLKATDLDLIASGDLLNQCMSSCYSVRDMGVSYIGLFGACSTMTLSTIVSALTIECGYSKLAAGVTSSHFCTAERQFRQPLNYGGQKPPSAQRTVTAGAAVILGAQKSNVYIKSVLIGSVVDFLVTDANNMGAAMAPDDVKIRPYPTHEGMVFFYTQIYIKGGLSHYIIYIHKRQTVKNNYRKFLLFLSRVLNRTLLQPNVQPKTRRPPGRRSSDVVIQIINVGFFTIMWYN